jgi:hypothetical protein
MESMGWGLDEQYDPSYDSDYGDWWSYKKLALSRLPARVYDERGGENCS